MDLATHIGWNKNLPDDLDDVFLKIWELPNGHSYISLSYTYKNDKVYEYKPREGDNDAL